MEIETIQDLDPAIKFGSYQQKDLANCKGLEIYTKNHCRLRKYTFQFWKCDDRKKVLCWMDAHMLASHFIHAWKNKILKIDPTLNVII